MSEPNDPLLPDGVYLLMLADAKYRDSVTGLWYIACSFAPVDPPYMDRRVPYSAPVNDTNQEALQELCAALRIDITDFVKRPSLFTGRSVLATVATMVRHGNVHFNSIRDMATPLSLEDS